ncbi:hypothetical protein N0V82_003818 [Gnomoniopsis sp. IMI 355080]|nr:hypothetical protein N0V82_003818 [Gnomoniopsis sp. IMI 355080]
MTIKAILFDFMGTCLDWHTSIVASLPPSISKEKRSKLALEWRQTYFDYNSARLALRQPPEDIDISHRQTLQLLLSTPEWSSLQSNFDSEHIERCIAAWHDQPAWQDVRPMLEKLRGKGYELFVHANGTTRLQLDLVRSSGLKGCFDLLLSSELLGTIKPAPESYVKCMELLRYKPEECVMVAAHAYDTRGAKKMGMKTVYIHRWTDDIKEDQEALRDEHDAYLGSMEQLDEIASKLN